MGTKVANPRGDFRSAQTTARARAAPEWAPGRDAEGEDPLCGALRGEARAGGEASRAWGRGGRARGRPRGCAWHPEPPRSWEPIPTAPTLVCAAGFTRNSAFPDLDPVGLRPKGPW